MTTIEEALTLIRGEVEPKATTRIACSKAVGRILAEDIPADLDSPPHRKSLVDGYAVRAGDTTGGDTQLQVVEEIFAGQVPVRAVRSGESARIMTGAPLPDGADAVVMVEQTELAPTTSNDQEFVRINATVSANQNVQERGSIMRAQDTVLKRGHRISPMEIGLLAEVGRTEIDVFDQPSMAILPTGDELVPASTVPAAGQIRNTNGPMLEALARSTGATANQLEVGRDDENVLRSLIDKGLRTSDILVLSGGVSMGRKDLVPELLSELNVRQIFHRVQLRPGKPIWFGVWKQADNETLVFGLPGNPVSSFVCFHLFVKPAIDGLCGAPIQAEHHMVRLAESFELKGNRPTYHPARYVEPDNSVEMLSWKGSADQRTMCEADCLVFFPTASEYQRGQLLRALPLR